MTDTTAAPAAPTATPAATPAPATTPAPAAPPSAPTAVSKEGFKPAATSFAEPTDAPVPVQDDKGLYFGKYKTLEDAAKGMKEAEKTIREMGSKVPKVPDSYDLKALEQNGLGAFENDQQKESTLKSFKDAGLTQDAIDKGAPVVRTLVEGVHQQNNQAWTNLVGFIPTNDAVQAQVETLQKKWGDGFAEKLAVSNRIMPELPKSIQNLANISAEVREWVYGLAANERGPSPVKDAGSSAMSPADKLKSITAAQWDAFNKGDVVKARELNAERLKAFPR
jgi:hypothetical protein